MKNVKILIFMIALSCASPGYASAQTGTGGFFNQQQSKFKIMLQQIISLQQQYATLKKGYNQAANGLNNAQQLKNGTFTLHADYYNSLKQVPASIRNNPKVRAITELQGQMIGLFDTCLAWENQHALLTSDEIASFRTIYASLLKDCQKNLEELRLTVTPGEMQMKDAERVKKIDQLYQATQQQFAFANNYTGQRYSLAQMRANENEDSANISKLYQTNP